MTKITQKLMEDWEVYESNAHDDWFANQYPAIGRLIDIYGIELMHELSMVQVVKFEQSAAAWMERARLAHIDKE